jgi:small subunit ribosomal protein S5
MREPQVGKDFEEKIVQVNRVSKKTKGGNKIGFSVLAVVGDRKGRVGVGLGGAPDVASAVRKAVTYAKKHLIIVPMKGTSIPHQVSVKRGAAKVMLKPAPPGTGVIAGGAVRAVVDASGIRDVVSKILGSKNKASNVYATLEALRSLRMSSLVKERQN